jgi:hypothetical protein
VRLLAGLVLALPDEVVYVAAWLDVLGHSVLGPPDRFRIGEKPNGVPVPDQEQVVPVLIPRSLRTAAGMTIRPFAVTRTLTEST